MKITLIIITLFVHAVDTLILSKSKITSCENKGLKGHGDPKNLVHGTSCKKKLLVVVTVKNNQKGTEKLHATVSRVRDQTTNDYARLYNPFMITVSKSPVYIIYPYFYTGFIVNNHPYEEIRMSKGNWWAIDSSRQCYDQWQKKERAELRPTCGYQYRTMDVKQADGTYKKVKERIWDSQGFCCHCSQGEKNAYAFNEAQNFKRSGLTCKQYTSKSQASGHCMKMDPLWYNVFSFQESYRDFTIHVKAFDQIEKVVKNKTTIDYVNGGEIVLSPSKKSGVGKYQRIIAHYVGDFAPQKSYPVLTSKYFLIPKLDGKVNALTHPQLKDGFSKYLILPMSFVDLRGGKCNMIGVSYSSFKNQASSGQGFGCNQKRGYCLNNQPFHYFKEDNERLAKGKTPRWFPTRYGKLAGVKKQKQNSSSFVLSYELQEEHTSLLSLQISADDLILVYNRATGEIVRAAVKDFEAVSMNGKLQVEVLNTGYVTADFHISIDSCTGSVDKIAEKSVSIDPQITEKLMFTIRSSEQKGGENNCLIHLYDAKRKLLGSRNVSFSTKAPCVCEVSGCRCECREDGSVRCVEMEGKWNISTKIWTVKKTSGLLGRIGQFFKDIWNKIKNLFNLFKWLKYVVPAAVCLLVLCVFFKCGGMALVKACCKCCCKSKSGGGGGGKKGGGDDGMAALAALISSNRKNEESSDDDDDKKKKRQKKNEKKKNEIIEKEPRPRPKYLNSDDNYSDEYERDTRNKNTTKRNVDVIDRQPSNDDVKINDDVDKDDRNTRKKRRHRKKGADLIDKQPDNEMPPPGNKIPPPDYDSVFSNDNERERRRHRKR